MHTLSSDAKRFLDFLNREYPKKEFSNPYPWNYLKQELGLTSEDMDEAIIELTLKNKIIPAYTFWKNEQDEWISPGLRIGICEKEQGIRRKWMTLLRKTMREMGGGKRTRENKLKTTSNNLDIEK